MCSINGARAQPERCTAGRSSRRAWSFAPAASRGRAGGSRRVGTVPSAAACGRGRPARPDKQPARATAQTPVAPLAPPRSCSNSLRGPPFPSHAPTAVARVHAGAAGSWLAALPARCRNTPERRQRCGPPGSEWTQRSHTSPAGRCCGMPHQAADAGWWAREGRRGAAAGSCRSAGRHRHATEPRTAEARAGTADGTGTAFGTAARGPGRAPAGQQQPTHKGWTESGTRRWFNASSRHAVPSGSARNASQQGGSGAPSAHEVERAEAKEAAHASSVVVPLVVLLPSVGPSVGAGVPSTVMLQPPSRPILRAKGKHRGGCGRGEERAGEAGVPGASARRSRGGAGQAWLALRSCAAGAGQRLALTQPPGRACQRTLQ